MRRPWLILLLLGASACLGPPTADDPASPGPTSEPPVTHPGRWTTRAALPTPRTELACAIVGANLYALGGFNAQAAPVPTVEAYDLSQNTWSRVADYPVAAHHLGVIGHKGILYGFGGHTGTQLFVATNTAFRYDPGTNAWTPETTLPRARGAFAIALRDDTVYLVGGTDSQGPGSTIHAVSDVYNLTTKQWSTGPSLTEPREHLAGAAADNAVVVAGGRRLSFATNTGATDSLTIGATQWTREEPMTARGGVAASGWNDQVFVFGGEEASGTFDEAEGFSVTTRKWVSYASMPTARHGLCAATAPDGIHVVGGGPQPAYTVSGAHEVLLPTDSTPSSG